MGTGILNGEPLQVNPGHKDSRDLHSSHRRSFIRMVSAIQEFTASSRIAGVHVERNANRCDAGIYG